MYSNVLCRGFGRIVFQSKPVHSSTKFIAVAGIHTSTTDNDTLGDLIQRLRFKYYHDPVHHLVYDKWAKIFTVEGNIKSGKGAFAEEFAKKQDLRYFPLADYTYEITAKERVLHPEEVEFLMRPESVYKKMKNISLERCYTNPEDWAHMARYQAAVIRARFLQYADATVHLIRTGQGVVIERSFYGLPVFEHAFNQMKWLNKDVLTYLYQLRTWMRINFLAPQVVLYLDAPPEQCLERIKKTGTTAEQCITIDYLNAIEGGYRKCLPEVERLGSAVVTLDWSTPESVEEVVMNLDDTLLPHHKYKQWHKDNGQLKNIMRELSDNFILSKMSYVFCPIEEMWEPDWIFWMLPAYQKSRPWKQIGFDSKKDKWLWLKEPTYKRDHRLF